MPTIHCKHCGSEDVWRDAIVEEMTKLERFMSKGPTMLASYGDYKVWEHPTMGDTAPVFLSTPDGRLINTGFYDLGDFDLDLCVELSEDKQ